MRRKWKYLSKEDGKGFRNDGSFVKGHRVCKCQSKLDRKDQLQLRGLKLLCFFTAWVRYVYFLQKTLVTLVLLCLNSAVRVLTRLENH